MACKRSAVRSRIPPPVSTAVTAQAVSTSPSSRGLGHRPFTAITGVRIPVGTPSRKRYAEVAQLVRVSACHAEGRGFEPRLPRQTPNARSSDLAFLFVNLLLQPHIYVALRQKTAYNGQRNTQTNLHSGVDHEQDAERRRPDFCQHHRHC